MGGRASPRRSIDGQVDGQHSAPAHPLRSVRATIGWWLTRRRSIPRHRHRCASSASAAKAAAAINQAGDVDDGQGA